MKDRVFNKPISKQFEFDEEVAGVFDDMLARSIPLYKQSIELIASFVSAQKYKNGRVYDLGCSTATQLLELERLGVDAELIGVDNAPAMLEQASKKIGAFGSRIVLYESDILEFPLESADVIICNYTLQFIRPMQREQLVKNIYSALKPNGLFIFSEKVISKDKHIDKEMINLYYKYKIEQGYSEYEIAKKREALENVLIPYTQDENMKMAYQSGFKHTEMLFRWVNFAMFVAVKG